MKECQLITTNITAVSCDYYLSPSGLSNWYESGKFRDTLQSFNGCDSIIIVDLTINETSSTILNIKTCERFISPSQKYIWNVSGTYFDNIPKNNGCDSLFKIKLTIPKIDTIVEQIENKLTAKAKSASYQWLDCNKGFSAITGAVDRIYEASENGNYAVEITQAGCFDTSSCYLVTTTVGIDQLINKENIRLYPNPVSDKMILLFPQIVTNASIQVINIIGNVVIDKREFAGNRIVVDMLAFSKGVYFVKISHPEQTATLKFFKN